MQCIWNCYGRHRKGHRSWSRYWVYFDIFTPLACKTLEHNNTSRNRKLFIHTDEHIYRPHRLLGNVRNGFSFWKLTTQRSKKRKREERRWTTCSNSHIHTTEVENKRRKKNLRENATDLFEHKSLACWISLGEVLYSFVDVVSEWIRDSVHV